jgi:hypothetical protein
MTTSTWTIRVELDEDADDTRAEAILGFGKTEFRGRGFARRHPQDEAVPRIGDELAIARALSGLAHQLVDAAAHDIEAKTHRPVASLSL